MKKIRRSTSKAAEDERLARVRERRRNPAASGFRASAANYCYGGEHRCSSIHSLLDGGAGGGGEGAIERGKPTPENSAQTLGRLDETAERHETERH